MLTECARYRVEHAVGDWKVGDIAAIIHSEQRYVG